MSRRSKETLAVQLFPFLAVLVCTMGSLIFLLLVTTRQVRQRAIAYTAFKLEQKKLAEAELVAAALPKPVEPDPTSNVIVIPPLPPQPEKVESKPVQLPKRNYPVLLAERERELNDLTTKWRLKADELTIERDRVNALLARRQGLIDTTQERTDAIKLDIDKLEVQLGAVAGESASTALESPDKADQLLIEKQIEEMKMRLRRAQAAEATAENEKFQVVPFDPKTGTTRRPIFLECTAEGIRFLPEGIVITAADLEGFTPRANPLAAGTAALINYWSVWNLQQSNPRVQPEPYVLMLVRPDGIVAYYVAMRMLDGIKTEHGYELLEESTPLKLPEPDSGAKVACQSAVTRLLAEREAIFRAAVNSGAAGSLFGGTPRVPRGGSGKPGGQGAGPISEGLAETRRSNGNFFQIGDVTGGTESPDERSWEQIDKFEGRPRKRAGTGSSANTPSNSVPSNPGGGNFAQQDGAWGDPGNSDPGMPTAKRSNRKQDRAARTPDGQTAATGTTNRDDEWSADDAGTYSQEDATSGSRSKRSLFGNNPSSPQVSGDSSQKPRRPPSDDTRQLEPEMLAGRRWGVSDPGAGIGYEREVRVDVESDKLIIAEKYAVSVEAGKSRQEIFEQFAMVLDKHSKEWGKAPQGFFWTPRLKFVVKPEANAQYERINAMMTRAGLGTSHEFANSPVAAKNSRKNAAVVKPAPNTARHPDQGVFR